MRDDRSASRSMRFFLTATSALLGLSFLGSCTTTNVEAMLPPHVEIVSTHESTVAVHAQGTGRRLGIGPAFVSDVDLQSAIEDAILGCELFSAITVDEGADYALRVKVTEFTKPESGLDMTAGLEVLWSLRDAKTRAVLWRETVTTAHTANTIGQGMLDERLQASIEGAVRENIQLGLEKLSALEL